MSNKTKKIILASASERRKELLANAGVDFKIISSNIDEQIILDKYILKTGDFLSNIREGVMETARAKALNILENNMEAIVIGADTIVVTDNKVLGKPKDKDEAYSMLRELFDIKQHVITGVCIISKDKEDIFYSDTVVEFYPWDLDVEVLVKEYVDSLSPMDKAGAYGIQDMGGLFVKKIDGDYNNVVGLPIGDVWRRLKKFNK